MDRARRDFDDEKRTRDAAGGGNHGDGRGMEMYLNKEQKELILSMLACGACLQIAAEHELFDGLAGGELAAMASRIKELCEEATKDVEQGSLRAMYNTADNAHIALIPKAVSYTHLRAHETD